MLKPPVSYTMPLPTQAIVSVAPDGVYDSTARAGPTVDALPTPYIPPRPFFFNSSPVIIVGLILRLAPTCFIS